jgi:hypothetical protein
VYGSQATGAGTVQVPAPLQAAAATARWVLTSQLGAWHSTPVLGYTQAARRVPPQVPPQVLPSVAQAGRSPTGAPVVGEQVPSWPGTLQASHCPAQGALQHTPSTQWGLLVVHWLSSVQGWPAPTRGSHTFVSAQ